MGILPVQKNSKTEKRFMRSYFLFIILLSAGILRAATPTTVPAAPPGDYELQEWVILIVNANQPNANTTTEFPSSLPGFVPSRRTMIDKEKAAQAMPIGVIRLYGTQADNKTKTDVLLEMKSGTFDSHWPKAESRSHRPQGPGDRSGIRPVRGRDCESGRDP